MRCLVFAIAMFFTGCSTHSQLGSGGSGDARGPGTSAGSETAIVWLDGQGAFPSVGYFDVQTIFNENELGPGSYVRVAALHVTGTSRTALIGKLRLRASQIGANRLLIVKAEVTKEEVHLYSDLEKVARFFAGEKTDADRSNEAYTLRIDAIAIRQSDDLSTVYIPRQGNDWPTVYRDRRPYDRRPTVYRPRRSYDRPSVYRPPRRDKRPTAYRPPRQDNRPPENPPPPKDDRPRDQAPPARDEPSDVKPPPPPPPEDKQPSPLKRPRMKTHQP